MEHVAGVLKELRTDAAGLARGAGGPGGAAGEAGEGDAVSALQREIAELAGSVGDTAAHADGEGWGGGGLYVVWSRHHKTICLHHSVWDQTNGLDVHVLIM